eukprot:TRINITY_DN14659_c0_g1_i1.p3 TRINITY_DN14659_c0_g1~~TRINITY_DN14659_c0_g1_i1.p3  ORF type:complete len:148 (+),score=26.05 TRINITY_DN14659_c0_g1_i1:64-444(+)
MGKFCTNCGSALQATNKFCANCGTAVGASAAPANPNAPPPYNPALQRGGPPSAPPAAAPQYNQYGQPVQQPQYAANGQPQVVYVASGCGSVPASVPCGDVYNYGHHGLGSLFHHFDHHFDHHYDHC